MRVYRVRMNAATQRSVRLLNALGSDVLLRALGGIGHEIVEGWRANIAKGRSTYHAFPALKPSYAREKERAVGKQPILVRTGAMRDSLAWRTARPSSARFILQIDALGAGVDRGRRTANIDKVRWAVQGSLGGARRGHRPASFGEALGAKKKSRVGLRSSYRVPPRVFTALKRNFFHEAFARAFAREVSRTGGRRL